MPDGLIRHLDPNGVREAREPRQQDEPHHVRVVGREPTHPDVHDIADESALPFGELGPQRRDSLGVERQVERRRIDADDVLRDFRHKVLVALVDIEWRVDMVGHSSHNLVDALKSRCLLVIDRVTEAHRGLWHHHIISGSPTLIS